MSPKTRHPLFPTWRAMVRRCTDKQSKGYRYYGARGITVCQRWRASFEAFCEDMGNRPSPTHELDRRNNDGPYEIRNCRWATRREQVRNSRRAHTITFRDKTMTLAEWAEETAICAPTLSGRLQRGWPIELALTTPTRVGQRVRQRNILPLLKQSGLSRTTFYARLAKGWTPEEAASTPRHQGQRHVSQPNDVGFNWR